MSYRPVTIIDIAKALNLSKSTVSRALNSGSETNPATRRLVMEYAAKNNYHPNPIALSLREKKSGTIGVVVPGIADNFFSQAINGIESVMNAHQYPIFINQSHGSPEKENINLKQLARRSVDGLLVSLSADTADLSYFRELQENGVPVVFFDRVPEEAFTHRVTINHYEGSFAATKHLIGMGKRTIAHITSYQDLSTAKERLAGYTAALQQQGLSLRSNLIHYCEGNGDDAAGVAKIVQQLLRQPNPPDAIFTASDELTTSCLMALRQLGDSAAGMITVAGYTNSTLTSLFDAPLLVIRQPAFDLGRKAAGLLLDLITRNEMPATFETLVLGTELMDHTAVPAHMLAVSA